jgi:hypothetical protein
VNWKFRSLWTNSNWPRPPAACGFAIIVGTICRFPTSKQIAQSTLNRNFEHLMTNSQAQLRALDTAVRGPDVCESEIRAPVDQLVPAPSANRLRFRNLCRHNLWLHPATQTYSIRCRIIAPWSADSARRA